LTEVAVSDPAREPVARTDEAQQPSDPLRRPPVAVRRRGAIARGQDSWPERHTFQLLLGHTNLESTVRYLGILMRVMTKTLGLTSIVVD